MPNQKISDLTSASQINPTDYWEIEQGGVSKQGTTDQIYSRTISFGTSVPFDVPTTSMGRYTVVGPLTFTINTVNARIGNGTLCEIVADGTHLPDFSAFTKLGVTDYNNTAGAVNYVAFYRYPTTYAVLFLLNMATTTTTSTSSTTTTTTTVVGSTSTTSTTTTTTTTTNGYVDIPFTSNAQVTNTAQVFTPGGSAVAGWDNLVLSPISLAGDGYVDFVKQVDSDNAMLGLCTSNSISTRSGINAGAVIPNNGTVYYQDAPSGGGSPTTAGGAVSNGDRVRIKRAGSLITLLTVSGGTETLINTYTFSTTALLYIWVAVFSPGGKLYTPKGFGIS